MPPGRTLPGFSVPLPPGLQEVIECQGCGRKIPAPPQQQRFIQCKVCGRKAHVLRLQPVGTATII